MSRRVAKHLPPFLRAGVIVALVPFLDACAARTVPAASSGGPVGPRHGAVVLAGGGGLGREIYARFVELAGGEDARIVVVPTAGAEDTFPPEWSGLRELREAGARNLSVLHTRDRSRADSPEFAAELKRATGVWIPGGRQYRLADVYVGTRFERALREVLARGGVVGGSSAGASILGSFLIRGSRESNRIVVAEDTVGFALLHRVAVDQHLLVRERQDDLCSVVQTRPNLLGIGIDEGTAIVVRRDRFEVLGRSKVVVYSVDEDGELPVPSRRYLSPGARFDLRLRRVETEPVEILAGCPPPAPWR